MRDRNLLPGNPGDPEGSEVGELGKRVEKRDFCHLFAAPTLHMAPRCLFGLQTPQGELVRSFLLLRCEKKKGEKKKQPNNFAINPELWESFVWVICLQNLSELGSVSAALGINIKGSVPGFLGRIWRIQSGSLGWEWMGLGLAGAYWDDGF